MPEASLFAQLLGTLGAVLKRHGFARAKHLFWKASDQNVAVIEVQRSTKSTAQKIVFTLNLGVCSARIARVVSGKSVSRPPEIAECHWRERVGFLLGKREDQWWSVEQAEDLGAIERELPPILENFVIPVVSQRSSDQALRDEWLTGNAPGLTEMQRLMYLSTLLVEIGPREGLEPILAELMRESEGKPSQATVQRHLQKLELNDRQTSNR